MRLPLAIAALVLSSTFWSCSQRLTAPQDGGATIRLEVRLSAESGDPQHPLDVSATATNRGRRTAYHSASCWLGAISFELLDPSGESLLWYDPRMVPLCPEACCLALDPGGSTAGTLRFTGRLFTRAGVESMAPVGEYTVIARFEAHVTPTGGTPISTTRRATFHWSGASPDAPTAD